MDRKTLSRSVFRPVQHYLIHIPHIIRKQGPLRAYSTRSMERVIGVLSKLIKSKRKGGRNASLLVERFAIRNYVNAVIDIQDELNVIRPQSYNEASFMNLSTDASGAQLWEPFNRAISLEDQSIEGVAGATVKQVLLRYYRRSSGVNTDAVGGNSLVVAGRLWRDSTVFSSCMYRRRMNEFSRGNHYVMFTSPYRK